MIDKTLPEVDARAGLDDLHREIARDTRRRRVAIIAAAAAVLIAAAGAAFLVRDNEPQVVSPVDPTNWILVEAPGGSLLVSQDGGTTRPAPDPRATWADWSPDGRQLAYWTRESDEAAPQLWVSDVAGKDKRVLARCGTCEANYNPTVAWSPDGTTLVYDLPRSSGGTLRFLTLATGDTRDLTLPRALTAPRWSPDGRQLALLEQVRYGGYVDVVDPAAGVSSMRRVTRNMEGVKRVDWSPDGTQIAFTAGSYAFDVGETANLYVVDADGTGQRQVTDVNPGVRLSGVDWTDTDTPFLVSFMDIGDANGVVARVSADGTIDPIQGAEGPIYGGRPRQRY